MYNQSDASLTAYFDDYGRRVAAQCLDHDRAFVLSISANNFARDIEMVRQALGERSLNFGMISNSGPVAAVYASLFPQHVRAMLIDSTVAPEFRDYIIERWSEESASYDLALQRVDQLCRRDPSCPLRETGVVTAFDHRICQVADGASDVAEWDALHRPGTVRHVLHPAAR